MTHAQRLDDLAERVATARTRWLLGERTEAREMLQRARIDYLVHREELRATAGVLAMERSMAVAESAMRGDANHE